jgi:hypothetical protein
MTCSSLRGQLRPPQPDATAVLAAVKVVRPRFAAGVSTLTAAAGRKIRQLRREQPVHAHTPASLYG